MRITTVEIQHYALPLLKPVTVGLAQATVREGLILMLHSNTEHHGYGEVAPLPGLHKETLVDAANQLAKYRSHLQQLTLTPDMLSFDGHLSQSLALDLFPSVRAGIEMAMLDLLLQANPALSNMPKSLPLNALLAADDNTITEQVEDLLSQGFTSIKIKVARQSLERDISAIQTVLSQTHGRAILRLDTNRGWTLNQAKQFCQVFGPQDIEYIEEPTQDPADHLSLSRTSRIPIALDETMAEILCEQLPPECYRAVILKPAVLGGLENTARIFRWARQHHITTVLSSAFETSLAIRMYLFFAVLNGITQTPLGLDTVKWFKEDLLLSSLVVENGAISLSSLSTRPELDQRFLKPLEEIC